MSDITSAGAAGMKTLWIAVAALGTAVVGLGGALYYTYTQAHKSEDIAVAAPAAKTSTAAAPAVPEAPTKHAAAPQSHSAAQKTTKPVATLPTETRAPTAKAVCADCATVTAVTPVEREGQGSGVGAVAGGVLGALVGNQFGQGQGKDVATIVGAVGGGFAGNQVEKKMKKVTSYQVDLRMDDGSRRTLELATPVGVGERVRLDGDTLRPLPANN